MHLSRHDYPALQPHSERLAQVGLEAIGGKFRQRCLDQQRHLVHLPVAAMLDDELGDLRIAPHDFLHLRGVEGKAAQREPVDGQTLATYSDHHAGLTMIGRVSRTAEEIRLSMMLWS